MHALHMRSYFSIVVLVLLVGCASGNRPLQLVGGAGPIYPPEARAEGIEGYVEVRYDVDVEGRVFNLAVVEAQPVGVFDAAALKAVASWRFNPRRENGRAVESLGRVSRVGFQLSGSQAYDDYE